MNIRAVMAALDIWDLDHAAKHALVVICCRADRSTGLARVAVGRVAADMKVTYLTARTALNRVVEAGYLTVDKSPGTASNWQVTSLLINDPTSLTSDDHLVTGSRAPRYSVTTKESLEKTKERHPRRCLCGGSGWLTQNAGGPLTAIRCPGGEQP